MFSPLKTLGMIYLKRRPFLLNHKINIRCDCRCKFCNSWQTPEEPGSLLSREEILSLLDRAAAAGMLSYSVWGGEPLLREDAPAVLAHARARGFFTTLSTNGSLLTERAAEFGPHTSLFLVSLDGLGQTHDRVRGFPGLFERVTAGLTALRRQGARVRLYYNVNRDTLAEVADAARLARELKVSIFYFPVVKFPGYNDRLVLDRESEQEAFARILELKRSGYPVINLASYLALIRDGRETKCSFPQYHVYADYDGELYTCDLGPGHQLLRWGNARTTDLAALFAGPEFRTQTRALTACNACRLSCAEIGYGRPLLQFPVRAWDRLRHEWIFQSG